jgi:hypothetical protein
MRRLPRLAVCAVCACAPATSVTRAHQLVPSELAARPGGDDFANVPLVIHIVNSTTQPYRLSLVVGGDTRVLGSVQGFDACDFVVDRRAIFGYGEFQLVAIARAGTGRRESDRFTLSGVRALEWAIDGTMTRYVRLR